MLIHRHLLQRRTLPSTNRFLPCLWLPLPNNQCSHAPLVSGIATPLATRTARLRHRHTSGYTHRRLRHRHTSGYTHRRLRHAFLWATRTVVSGYSLSLASHAPSSPVTATTHSSQLQSTAHSFSSSWPSVHSSSSQPQLKSWPSVHSFNS